MVAVIVVELVTLTPVAATPPIVTVAPETKFVPVIVIAVPPDVEPKAGETPVTTGPADRAEAGRPAFDVGPDPSS